MQTHFSQAQRADPGIAHAEDILRKCVHCGFCMATCPTYVELGNELDSPRGRIYLIKDMLEAERPATKNVVTHIDRCLSCLSCMTTCPSGVNYMHLVDLARTHIEKTYRRPLWDRLIRKGLASILPYPNRFRLALAASFFGRPLLPVLSGLGGPFSQLAAMLRLAPVRFPPREPMAPGTVFPATSRGNATGRMGPIGRVALLTGCAQPVLAPEINAATRRVLSRLGFEVVLPQGEGCCGALVHHMGQERSAQDFARANIDAWIREIEAGGLDAIIITASGCGTTIKDYGHMLASDPEYAEKANQIAALAMDITEFLADKDLPGIAAFEKPVVAYHSACSMQHGQKITTQPRILLERAGFSLREIPEGHLCCGSAGTYNILQPAIATRLRDRKVKNIRLTQAELIATGNIGCMAQIKSATDMPILHTIELLDWAQGGPRPENLD